MKNITKYDVQCINTHIKMVISYSYDDLQIYNKRGNR